MHNTILCRIIRSAGTLGEVSVVWQLSPMDTNTFQIVSDSVTLINGQQSANFTVSVSTHGKVILVCAKEVFHLDPARQQS